MDKVPLHVAIIPDGNRRWAKAHDLPVHEGHERGFAMVRELVRYAGKKNITYLSLWGLSLDNFTKRSPLEVAHLLRIFHDEFSKLIDDKEIHEGQVRVQILGRWREKFPAPHRAVFEKLIEVTAGYNKRVLTIFLAYNGTDEMLSAVNELVAQGRDDKDLVVDANALKQHLFTADMPSVDLVIRTAGEKHISAGFMMWDTADSELYFPECYWPDFSNEEFDKALAEYGSRRRMKGK